jgi:hypothetical protein
MTLKFGKMRRVYLVGEYSIKFILDSSDYARG